MKLTIEIQDGHAPELLQFLASLHADLTADGDTRWGPVWTGPEGTEPEPVADTDPFAADPLKVAMNDPVEEITEPSLSQQAAADLRAALDDPTQRDLPFPDGLPELPPLPEGKTRWVHRGRFSGLDIETGDRIVYYADSERFIQTCRFSTCLHHVEAI